MKITLIPSMRGDERRDAFSAFVTLFAFMTGFALLETARDALFLASFPASWLAGAYLVIAVFTLVLTRFDHVLFGRFAAGSELRVSLLLSSAVTLVFWLLAATGDALVFFLLYIWTGAVATFVVVRFWTALGTRFTVDQAKRLFAFVGSGSVLGAIAGSFVARLLSEVGPPQTMILFAGASFLASGLVSTRPSTATIAPTGPEARQNWTPKEVLELVWSRAYLRRVAIVVLTASITFTLVDYLFKSTVDRLVAPAAMGEVFASIYLGLHVLSLIVQLVFVSGLVRRLGVNHAHAIVPSLLLFGAGTFAIFGGLVAAFALKVIDGGLRHSLYRTTIELLFVPVTGELRARVKAFIDVLGQRGGQALASLGIIGLLGLGARDGVIAVAIVVTAAAWLSLALALRRDYLDVFRETLGHRITETQMLFPALDLASMETLLSTLGHSDDRRVLAALDLLGEQGKAHVIPALVLYHPSPAIVLKGLELFRSAGRTDFLQIADRLSSHPDAELRAAILPVRATANPSIWTAALSDPSVVVRATALVGLADLGLASAGQMAELERFVESGPTEARLAVARALHGSTSSFRVDLLQRLSRVDDLEVLRVTLAAIRAHPSPRLVGAVVPLLTERSLRDEARECLVATGPPALGRLGELLADVTFDYPVRRRLPKTIGSFMNDDAARILLGRLLDEMDGLVRFKILSALGHMRRARADLHLDNGILNKAIDLTVASAMTLARWRATLERGLSRERTWQTPTHAILVRLMRHKQLHALERLFRLINLQQPSDDLPRIFRALQNPDRQTLASSRELVENLFTGERRHALVALIDGLFSGTPDEAGDSAAYRSVVGELLQCSSEALSALAAHHASELRASDLVPHLQEVRGRFTDRHDDVVMRALADMSRPAVGDASHVR